MTARGKIDDVPPGSYTEQELHNREAVLEFHDLLKNQRDLSSATKYVGARFIQHNPDCADGLPALFAFTVEFVKSYPLFRVEVQRVFVQADMVALHVRSFGGPSRNGAAAVDIYRLEDGRIVEHWDVIRPVPDVIANSNTMF